MEFINQFWTANSKHVEDAFWIVVKIIVLFIVARVTILISTRAIKQFFRIKGKMDERRRGTLVSLFSNVIKYVVYFVLLLTILPMFGIDIKGILAGAGVAGIAIAFGAQSLIKDFFNGFFIIFEDQYGVGDYVKINNVEGQVHSIGLRMTSVKVWTGEVEIIPNGQISQLTNYSKFNSFATIDINVGYGTPEQEAIQIIENVLLQLQRDSDDIVGDVDVLGVQTLNDSNYTIRSIAECAPYSHWGVMRAARQKIREALNNAGADLPYQKIVYLNEDDDQIRGRS